MTPPVPHGAHRGYTYYHCRCGRCSEAYRLYQRAMRARHLAEMTADPTDRRHGTVYGYHCGCRCTPCHARNSAEWRRRHPWPTSGTDRPGSPDAPDAPGTGTSTA